MNNIPFLEQPNFSIVALLRRLGACIFGKRVQIVAIADHQCGQNKDREPDRHEDMGPLARPLPFTQGDTPEGAEDDDGRHVHGPAGELVFAHLCFAHAVC